MLEYFVDLHQDSIDSESTHYFRYVWIGTNGVFTPAIIWFNRMNDRNSFQLKDMKMG